MAIIFVRTIIIFVVIVAALKLMGKRQLGELELSELVVAVLISDMAALPLEDIGIPLLNGLVPVITLLCCELLISYGSLKSIKFRKLMWGKPSLLIDNGKIVQQELKANRFSLDELTESLRKKDITDISTVRYAILETDGTLNTVLYQSEQPVTVSMMNIKLPEKGIPIAVISDGRILKDNLRRLGKDEKWLSKELKGRNNINVKDVYYMTLDDAENIYFAAKESGMKAKQSLPGDK
ncbi:MAG: DUF421 domain-containing protein [Clostridiales bacterium]|jgi:uncharacterized membrane protein YcaP (DUF421 family)|nr:DUF421 domain-containing protein [Clostridiales bacterium]